MINIKICVLTLSLGMVGVVAVGMNIVVGVVNNVVGVVAFGVIRCVDTS